jgi:hypothetical protein
MDRDRDREIGEDGDRVTPYTHSHRMTDREKEDEKEDVVEEKEVEREKEKEGRQSGVVQKRERERERETSGAYLRPPPASNGGGRPGLLQRAIQTLSPPPKQRPQQSLSQSSHGKRASLSLSSSFSHSLSPSHARARSLSLSGAGSASVSTPPASTEKLMKTHSPPPLFAAFFGIERERLSSHGHRSRHGEQGESDEVDVEWGDFI